MSFVEVCQPKGLAWNDALRWAYGSFSVEVQSTCDAHNSRDWSCRTRVGGGGGVDERDGSVTQPPSLMGPELVLYI